MKERIIGQELGTNSSVEMLVIVIHDGDDDDDGSCSHHFLPCVIISSKLFDIVKDLIVAFEFDEYQRVSSSSMPSLFSLYEKE